MKFGIAVFPSKEVQDFANSYRKRYDPHYTLIQPHLTVRSADEWTDEQLERAVAHLDETSRKLVPFQAEFNRFSSFYPVSNVIYMALADPEPFTRLHKAVCSGPLAETETRYRYNPHLTVGRELSDDELHDVLASLRKVPVSFTFKVDRLHLLYQTANGAWTVHQTFLFQGS